jgi:hypothetical protein
MLGALAPLKVPVWLGASRLEPPSFGSLRYLREALNEHAPPARLAASFARKRPWREFVVYRGGRSQT